MSKLKLPKICNKRSKLYIKKPFYFFETVRKNLLEAITKKVPYASWKFYTKEFYLGTYVKKLYCVHSIAV